MVCYLHDLIKSIPNFPIMLYITEIFQYFWVNLVITFISRNWQISLKTETSFLHYNKETWCLEWRKKKKQRFLAEHQYWNWPRKSKSKVGVINDDRSVFPSSPQKRKLILKYCQMGDRSIEHCRVQINLYSFPFRLLEIVSSWGWLMTNGWI